MEGMGSRLGRASSRYGSATVFSGPVRRWKKRWVHVSSSPTVNCQNSQSSGGEASRLLLCRWTPISSSAAANVVDGDRSSAVMEEPPRRKFRYTPIAVLDEQKKEVAKQVHYGAKTSEITQSPVNLNSKSSDLHGNPNISTLHMEKSQASVKNQLTPQNSHESYMDSACPLKGEDNSHNSNDEDKKEQFESVCSRGFQTRKQMDPNLLTGR